MQMPMRLDLFGREFFFGHFFIQWYADAGRSCIFWP
jgi:hypothetical protein